jgi:hypothetical protein
MLDIKIGSDPELFVTQKGKFRCAAGLIPGTKEVPHPVKNGAVQIDGFALEFNTDPASTEDEFVGNVTSVMDQLRQMVEPQGYEFAIVPSARFNGNHFNAQSDEAKELGCTPDYNAYTMAENPKPDNKTTMRTASGHVHIGFTEGADPNSEEHMIRCSTLIKQLDVYLGLPSLFFDSDVKRRKMYGQAGSFRPKPYGVEYRVLSNAWLLSEARMRFVYSQTVKAVNDLIEGKRPFEGIGGKNTQMIIDRSDLRNARYHIPKYLGQGTYDQARRLAFA